RLAYFQPTNTYLLYGPMLLARRDEIAALPEALTSNRPKAALLGQVDVRHDGYGAALWHLAECILRHPDSSPELRERATRVREGFVPRLRVLKEKYVDESRAADRNREKLATFQADLEAIPTPLGGNALAWATGFVEAGEQIGMLLSDRATIQANAAEGAGLLRSTTLGLVSRARQALEDEVAHNPALPRNLVKLVFGYFDLLQSFREKQPTGEEPPPPPAE
ncbi:MAG TPA: hypothetical protein VLS89_01525, partial [Candidatus Nanopelagicales bacterium]|nr:hypothetical protein [Candidatus Nanopelagicales bacterium]